MPASRPPRRARLLASLLGMALAGALGLAPVAVQAQDDEGPAPSEAAPSSAPLESSAPAGEAVALVPSELAGTPVDPENVVVFRGQEIIEMNPAAAEQLQAVADATGTSIDDMTQVSAYVEPAEGDLVFFGAVQVSGADAVAVLDVLLALSLETMQEPRVEVVDIEGRQVTVLYEDAAPTVPPTNLIASGDVIWIVQADEAYVTAVIEQLPG